MKSNKEYYGKAYRLLRFARYSVLVIFVLFTVFSMTFYKDEITFDNFRYLMKYIEISPPAMEGNSSSLRFSASSSANFALINDKVVIINPENISSYDMAGRKILDENINYSNPISVKNSKYVLIYDLDGYSLSVYNSFSKVFETTLKTPIEYVYLCDNGGFAVITREKTYAGGVVAYNSKFSKVFTFMTRTANVTDVCFDSHNGYIACATTDVREGDFYSEILTFDITDDKDYKSRTELYGELPLSMFCAGKGFALMTDKGIHYYDYNGADKGFSDFGYDTPCSLFRFGDFFAVTLKSALARTDTTMNIYSYGGELLFNSHYSEEISYIDAAHGKLYILEQFGLGIHDYDSAYNFTAADNPTPTHEGEYKQVFSLPDGEYLLISQTGAAKFVSQPPKAPDETAEEEK